MPRYQKSTCLFKLLRGRGGKRKITINMNKFFSNHRYFFKKRNLDIFFFILLFLKRKFKHLFLFLREIRIITDLFSASTLIIQGSTSSLNSLSWEICFLTWSMSVPMGPRLSNLRSDLVRKSSRAWRGVSNGVDFRGNRKFQKKIKIFFIFC